MDRIQALRLYTRVVDLGSFSRAATELGIGQPAATKQVAKMEKSLGARLLFRSTQGVRPTEIGKRYYEKCKLIAHHDEEARSVTSLMQSQVSGILRINTSIAFGRRVLSQMVLDFMNTHPGLLVDLSFDDRYVNLIEHGIDVAIRMGRLADSSLGASTLGISPWVTVAAPSYLAQHGPLAAPADLRQHQTLIYSTAQGDAVWHYTGDNGKACSVSVNGKLRSNNLSVLLSAARQGFGVAVLPRYVAHTALTQRAIVPVLEAWHLPVQEVHAVYPSPRLVPAKVHGFVNWLKGQFTSEWWKLNSDINDVPGNAGHADTLSRVIETPHHHAERLSLVGRR